MLTSAQKAAHNFAAPHEGLGNLLSQKRGVLKCTYDFAVQGGAVGSYKLLDSNGNAAKLPAGAIITQVYLHIVTAFVSTSNDGTISLGANTAVDLLAAVDADTLSGISAGVPVGTAGTMVRCTAERQITLAVAVHAMTAGKANFFVEFVISE